MNKMTTSLFGFALAGLVLVGAGCMGGNSAADLEGNWEIDPANEAAESLEGTNFGFADSTMTMTVEFLGETATMIGGYEQIEVGSEGDQGQADFALRFKEFKMSVAGEEEILTGDDAPFTDVHVKFGEDKKTVTLFENTLDDKDNAVLIKKEE